MSTITRNPIGNSKINYDAIIIGGGIYGIMLSLIAAQRGLRTLLLEKKDFGGQTSYNHLKILHGGFRYLQNLDLPRFFESVGERRWFMQNFNNLVRPLPCLMPLYNKGIYRKSIFKIALLLNDILSFRRNKELMGEKIIASGKIISAKEVEEIFPGVDTMDLKGGAVWYDCSMPDSQRIVIELLKYACFLGADALNYCKAINIIKNNNAVEAVEAVDLESNSTFYFKSNIVINSAGPWTRDLAQKFDTDLEYLFRPSLAWNILFDKPALSNFALAITPKKKNKKTYFLKPWKNHLFAGTIHEKWAGDPDDPKPSIKSIKEFINDLNFAIPELGLSEKDILHIYAGIMPSKADELDKPAVRPVIVDHSRHNGPKGLYSISGVKFTTARLLAEETIKLVFPRKKIKLHNSLIYKNINLDEQGIFEFDWYPGKNSDWEKILQGIIKNESVVHIDDLILRRTSIGDNPERALNSAVLISKLFNWNEEKTQNEIERLENFYINPFREFSEILKY